MIKDKKLYYGFIEKELESDITLETRYYKITGSKKLLDEIEQIFDVEIIKKEDNDRG